MERFIERLQSFMDIGKRKEFMAGFAGGFGMVGGVLGGLSWYYMYAAGII
tara:strand:- start:1899 stop:2048 length:150 start_codon:yes stop_codon:yes gene_type:complete